MTARASDQLAEVTWTAPTPDDPTITGYTITASPGDIPPITVDPTARTATVTGLTNGTAYTFTVAATNPDGTSRPSDPSAPCPPSPTAAITLAASPTSVLTAAPSSCPAVSSRPTPPRASLAKRSPSSGAPREEPAGPRSPR